MIILCSPRQDLYAALDLLIMAYDRVPFLLDQSHISPKLHTSFPDLMPPQAKRYY
jgi:hypothetical protein